MSSIDINLSTLKEEIAEGYLDGPLKEYMDLKAIGRDSFAALTVAFGTAAAMSGTSQIFIAIIEGSQKYIEGTPAALERMKHVTIWDAQIAARHLYAIASTAAKASERLAAARELNVIYGITTVDEQGRTRRGGGMTLADFYKLEAKDASDQQKAH
jgi:hypothetical protein